MTCLANKGPPRGEAKPFPKAIKGSDLAESLASDIDEVVVRNGWRHMTKAVCHSALDGKIILDGEFEAMLRKRQPSVLKDARTVAEYELIQEILEMLK